MPGSRRVVKSAVFIAVLLFLSSAIALAFDDGFGSAKKIEGKYFMLYYTSQLQISNLIQNLNITSSDNLMVGKPAEKKSSPEAELADMLDTLFMRVSDILDMHVYSFQGNIKVCEDTSQLKKIYKDLFNRDLTALSFFVGNLNTIYITADSFKREILGHETAHAVMTRYFVVQPPVKIHEILAMYVEYQLRRAAK